MLFERIKESDGEHVANLYVKQRTLRHKSYGIVNQPEPFCVESTNNIKIEIPHVRVIENGCIWEKITPLMNAC